jgi:hypothetical protein
MDVQLLRRRITYVVFPCFVLLGGCAINSVSPCFSLGAKDNTLNQIGVQVNIQREANDYSCHGNLSTDLENMPFPYKDGNTDPIDTGVP